MKIDYEILKLLREYDDLFKNVTEKQLLKGYQLSLEVKEFDSPEEYLDEEELFCLSAYYEYQAQIESKKLNEQDDGDDYVFDPEDLEEE